MTPANTACVPISEVIASASLKQVGDVPVAPTYFLFADTELRTIKMRLRQRGCIVLRNTRRFGCRAGQGTVASTMKCSSRRACSQVASAAILFRGRLPLRPLIFELIRFAREVAWPLRLAKMAATVRAIAGNIAVSRPCTLMCTSRLGLRVRLPIRLATPRAYATPRLARPVVHRSTVAKSLNQHCDS